MVGHDEEIGGRDLVNVIGEERPPRLAWRALATRHVFRDRGFADVDAQLQELAVNPRRAPQRIHDRHRANQRADVSRHRGSSRTVPTLPGPEQTEALPMPGEHGLGLHDDDRHPPSSPHARQPGPE